jgi:hypothetical protein
MADLRSNSVDYKRDSESKAKWARGEAWGPGRAKEAHGAPSRVKPRYVIAIIAIETTELIRLQISTYQPRTWSQEREDGSTTRHHRYPSRSQ